MQTGMYGGFVGPNQHDVTYNIRFSSHKSTGCDKETEKETTLLKFYASNKQKNIEIGNGRERENSSDEIIFEERNRHLPFFRELNKFLYFLDEFRETKIQYENISTKLADGTHRRL